VGGGGGGGGGGAGREWWGGGAAGLLTFWGGREDRGGGGGGAPPPPPPTQGPVWGPPISFRVLGGGGGPGGAGWSTRRGKRGFGAIDLARRSPYICPHPQRPRERSDPISIAAGARRLGGRDRGAFESAQALHSQNTGLRRGSRHSGRLAPAGPHSLIAGLRLAQADRGPASAYNGESIAIAA